MGQTCRSPNGGIRWTLWFSAVEGSPDAARYGTSPKAEYSTKSALPDLDRALADEAARKAPGHAKVTAHTVDVRDRSALVELLGGARVCVNAVQYNFNLDVMEGCLAAGVEYLDFGGLFHTTKKQLELHERYRAAGLLAVPGMGQVPGISNILAAAAADDLVSVDSIMVRDGWKDFTQGAPPVVFTWSPSTFLDGWSCR